MSRRSPRRVARLTLALALAAPVGCVHAPSRPRVEHDTASLLDSGPTARVSARQAADVRFALGRTHEEEGRPDQAEAAYRSALERDPRRADAEARLAILADRKGDGAGADRHFERALKLEPANPETLCDRGYSLYLRRRWSDAEASLRRALAADPAHPRAHNNLGLVLARRGDTDGALAEFARAGADRSDARANLALVLALEGRLDESRDQYALALRDKPDSPAAREGLRVATTALAAEGRSLARAGGTAPPADASIRRASTP